MTASGCKESELENEFIATDGGDPSSQEVAIENASLSNGVGTQKLNATDNDKWVYFDLDRFAVVSPEDPYADNSWDIAFQRFKIKINSGVSGNGQVTAAVSREGGLLDVITSPEIQFLPDRSLLDLSDEEILRLGGNLFFSVCQQGFDDRDADNYCLANDVVNRNRLDLNTAAFAFLTLGSGVVFEADGTPGEAILGWYDYYPDENHLLRPSGDIWVINSSEGVKFAFEMLGYYGLPEGSAESGNIAFHYTPAADEDFVLPPPGAQQLGVSASADVISGSAPLLVNFSAESSGAIGSTTYTWNFGDGGTATGQAVAHTFNDAGGYTVSVTATDERGAAGGATSEVFIQVNAPDLGPVPVANAGADQDILLEERGGQVMVQLDGTASMDDDNNIASYVWSGEPLPLAEAQPTVVLGEGMYMFTLTVTDANGQSSQDTVTITVRAPDNQLPDAVAIADVVTGPAPLSVNFSGDQSSDPDGSLVNFAWDFGDGATANGVNATHVYTVPGQYAARLTVMDADGAMSVDIVAISVAAPILTAAIDSNVVGGDAPLEVTFDATTSGAQGDVDYTWDFGDGNSASGATVTHTYTQIGVFTATLTATDDRGPSSAATATVTITVDQVDLGPAPIADAGTDLDFTLDSPGGQMSVMLDASASSDGDNNIASYVWNGTPDPDDVPMPTVVLGEGQYVFELTVTDANGQSSSDTVSVTVRSPSNSLPLAIIETDVVGGQSPLTVQFSAAGSSDADGTIDSYVWEFGDGSADASGVTVSHTYASAGDYIARLTVTDNEGASASAVVTISVAAPPLIAGISSDVVGGDAPLTVSFTSNIMGAQGAVVLLWDFDDGSSAQGANVVHTFTTAGDYTVRLTATDERGPSAAATAEIVITVEQPDLGPAPIANAGPDQTVVLTSAGGQVSVQLDGSGSTDADNNITSYVWSGNPDPLDEVSPVVSLGMGQYVFQLTVTDANNQSSQDTVTIVVEDPVNQLPLAAITTDTDAGVLPLAVEFSGSNSSDPDGSIVSYEWDFGDGSMPVVGENVSHTYTTAGQFSARLTVMDADGATADSTVTIRVSVQQIATKDTFVYEFLGNQGSPDGDSGGISVWNHESVHGGKGLVAFGSDLYDQIRDLPVGSYTATLHLYSVCENGGFVGGCPGDADMDNPHTPGNATVLTDVFLQYTAWDEGGDVQWLDVNDSVGPFATYTQEDSGLWVEVDVTGLMTAWINGGGVADGLSLSQEAYPVVRTDSGSVAVAAYCDSERSETVCTEAELGFDARPFIRITVN